MLTRFLLDYTIQVIGYPDWLEMKFLTLEVLMAHPTVRDFHQITKVNCLNTIKMLLLLWDSVGAMMILSPTSSGGPTTGVRWHVHSDAGIRQLPQQGLHCSVSTSLSKA